MLYLRDDRVRLARLLLPLRLALASMALAAACTGDPAERPATWLIQLWADDVAATSPPSTCRSAHAAAMLAGATSWADSFAWTPPPTPSGYYCVRGTVTDTANQATTVVNPFGLK